jgi:hypothetical protein
MSKAGEEIDQLFAEVLLENDSLAKPLQVWRSNELHSEWCERLGLQMPEDFEDEGLEE